MFAETYMNKFRTEVNPAPSSVRIGLSDRILTLGSCFSDAIGSQFLSHKIDSKVNPFGILYNPHSIHKVISYSIFNHPPDKNSFVQRDDVFLHYDFHSAYSSMSLGDLKQQLKSSIASAHSFLLKAKWLIITYGTAWVYEHTESTEVVANCHKMPANLFKKSLLTQKKILDSFETLYRDLKSFNPDIQVILTVSPVRHMKETLELNAVSKSVLRVACHTMTEQHEDVHYFPAYEILMDDLRDYRFYSSDMIHPSETAEAYIWQKFGEQYLDKNLLDFLAKWDEIKAALDHRPFQPTSAAHQRFIRETIKKLAELKNLVNVEEEMSFLNKQLLTVTEI